MKRKRGTEIPKDVLFEILKRLPIKSLCRLRSVSSSWLSVISDPHFIRSQYANRSRLALFYFRLGPPCKFVIYDQEHSELVATAAVELPSEIVMAQKKIWSNLPSTSAHINSQSVHGLICFCLATGSSGLTILNPSTRECISASFPRVTGMRSPGGSRVYWYHCFGFDPAAEKHKVLCAFRASNMKSRHPINAIELMVFTVGSVDNWRSIGTTNIYHRKSDLQGEVCIDGVIYFVSSCYGSTRAYYLASFDLKLESFKFVKLAFPGNILSCKLIEFHGSVALVDKHIDDLYHTKCRVSLWVLENFDEQVWDLKRSLVAPDLSQWTICLRGLYLACALRRGDLLVFTTDRNDVGPVLGVFFFDTVSNCFWTRGFPVPRYYTSVICSDHVESLFCLS